MVEELCPPPPSGVILEFTPERCRSVSPSVPHCELDPLVKRLAAFGLPLYGCLEIQSPPEGIRDGVALGTGDHKAGPSAFTFTFHCVGPSVRLTESPLRRLSM